MDEENPKVSSNRQHVDEVNGSCYGKQNLYKIYGRDEYRGVCKYDCRIKAECISASRENREEVNRELAKARAGDGREKEDMVERLDAGAGISWEAGRGSGGHDYICERLAVPVELRAVFVECVERIAGLYLETPEIFDALIRRLFAGQNHSDRARLRGVTRQAVCSRTLKNYAGIVKDLMPELPRCLTDVTERTVYMLVFVDRLSIREASKRSGISAAKICRVKRKIASKLGKNETGGRKKIQDSSYKFQESARRLAGGTGNA